MRMFWSCVALALACVASLAVRTATETALATWPLETTTTNSSIQLVWTGTRTWNLAFLAFIRCSPRGSLFTYVEREAPTGNTTERIPPRARVVVNGVPGPWYDGIQGGVHFVPEERPFYIAHQGDKYLVVIDGKESAPYESVKMLTMAFGQTGDAEVIDKLWNENAVAMYVNPIINYSPLFFVPGTPQTLYVARRDSKDVLVIDGVERASYDAIRHIASSPDGKRMALFVKKDGAWRVIIDGVMKDRIYDEPPAGAAFTFSSNGRHFLFQAICKGRKVDVFDGKIIDGLPFSTGAVFSHTNLNLPYVSITRVQRLSATAPKAPKERYPVIHHLRRNNAISGPVLATIVKDGAKMRLRIGKELSAAYDNISGDEWCPLANGVACVAKTGGKEVMLVNGVAGKRYDEIRYYSHSPNEKRLAYVAQDGARQVVVVDGKESIPHKKVHEYSLLFSPDSTQFAYMIDYEDCGTIMVLNGKKSKVYNDIQEHAFTPKGDLYFIANIVRHYVAVINGEEGKRYDEIFSSIFFDAPGRFHYFARRGQTIYRVDERLEM